jgi:hypothetical protein
MNISLRRSLGLGILLIAICLSCNDNPIDNDPVGSSAGIVGLWTYSSGNIDLSLVLLDTIISLNADSLICIDTSNGDTIILDTTYTLDYRKYFALKRDLCCPPFCKCDTMWMANAKVSLPALSGTWDITDSTIHLCETFDSGAISFQYIDANTISLYFPEGSFLDEYDSCTQNACPVDSIVAAKQEWHVRDCLEKLVFVSYGTFLMVDYFDGNYHVVQAVSDSVEALSPWQCAHLR